MDRETRGTRRQRTHRTDGSATGARPWSRRQLLRRSAIFTSFLLFPVTLNYFSPALSVMGAAAGVLSGSACVFLAQFLSALVLGRSFCAWLCPGAGEQEACFLAQPKPVDGRRADRVKYLIWVPWMALIVSLLVRRRVHGVSFFYLMDGPISVDAPGRYRVYLIVVGTIFVLALTLGRRGFCHAACWMAPFLILGTQVGRRLGLPQLRLRAAPEACVGCGACTRGCPMSLDVKAMVEQSDLSSSECILCGACVDTCKRSAIRYSFGRGGGAARGRGGSQGA